MANQKSLKISHNFTCIIMTIIHVKNIDYKIFADDKN
jgi:hypothetical protein